MKNIFVYGTLKAGFYNHRRLGWSKFICEAETAGKYRMVNLGAYPGVIAGSISTIHGEVYAVDAEVLRDLDRLEGHPNFYRRTPTRCVDKTGNKISAEMYILQRESPGFPTIDDGLWMHPPKRGSAQRDALQPNLIPRSCRNHWRSV